MADCRPLLNLLRSDGSIVVNKAMARNIGLEATVLYSELVSKHFYFEERNQLTDDGYFFNTVQNLEMDTTLTIKMQRKAIKTLENCGLIKKRTVGMPARRYFKIVDDVNIIIKYLGSKANQQLVPMGRTRESQWDAQEWLNGPSNNTNRNNNLLNNNKHNALSGDNGTFETNLIITEFLNKYKMFYGKEHPRIKNMGEIKTIIGNVLDGSIEGNHDDYLYFDREFLSELIDEYFKTEYNNYNQKKVDHRIYHFLTDGILRNLYYKNM